MSNQIDLIQEAIAAIVAQRGVVTIGHLHMLVAERLMEDYHMTLEIMEAAGKVQLDGTLVRRASQPAVVQEVGRRGSYSRE